MRAETPRRERPLPGWLSAAVALGAGLLLLWLEKKRPLREPTESKLRRDSRNLAMAAGSAAAIHVVEKPTNLRVMKWAEKRGFGLSRWAKLPPWVEVAASVLLLDYTLYLWHVLTHKWGFLWRFHRVHHADLDLDATTALRFHFGEMLLSVPFRAGQIALLGPSPLSLSLWQTTTLAAILFHHSNVELPLGVERPLSRIFMTPRMHGIHHSEVKQERDSNWSTIFSYPDYLHGTHRGDVPQRDIEIGVPEPRDPEQLTLANLIVMPARRGAALRP